jgi:cytochrome c oxidase subunit 3
MEQLVMGKDKAFKDIASGKLGIWIFLIIDGLSFVAILIAASYLRTHGAPWPHPGEVLNVPLTAFNTFVLLLSSYTMMMALESVRSGDQKKFITLLSWTLFLGLLFLSIQAYEYYNFIAGTEEIKHKLALAGVGGDYFRPSSSIYAGCFFGATGFHGLHVLSGVIFILYVLIGGLRGRFTATNHLRVETLTLFWHFVDLMWMLVFTAVYLL